MKVTIGEVDLELKPVGWGIILIFAEKLGWVDYLNDQAGLEKALEQTSEAQRIEKLKALQGLLNYCAGWGVVDTPSQTDVKKLAFLSLDSELEQVQRANWVRVLLFEGDFKKSLVLFGKIADLSKPPEEEEQQE